MWNLEDYQLDPARFALKQGDHVIPLQRRPFDVLLYLIINRDRVVSREELLETVWEGVFVTPGAISTAIYEIRTAVGDLDRPRSERWIATVRGRGFQFVGTARFESPATPVHDPIPYVGRSEAMVDLSRHLERLRDGRGGIVLVEGPAGTGKTRLLQEVESAFEALTFHSAHCEQHCPAFWPWREIARSVSQVDGAKTSENPAARPVALDETWLLESHFERVDRIEALLKAAAAAEPLVVVIEDLHWADHASLAILESLAPRARNLPALFLLTQRSGEEGSVATHGLAESPFVDSVRLGPLEVRHLYTLVGAILGHVPSPELVGRIEQASQGIPLIVRELAHRLAGQDESWTHVPKLAHRVFAGRFDRVSADARLGLFVAALCGVVFDAPLVEAAAGDQLSSDRGWIREGVQAGILSPLPDHPLRFRFSHALLRDAAEGVFDQTTPPQWHARLTDALERQHPSPNGRAVVALARHSAAAAPVEADLKRPLRYALMAARQAQRVLDWSAAGVHAAHALDWIEYQPPGEARDRQEIEAALTRCAAIAWATGHVEETRTLLDRIAPALERVGDPQARAVADGFRFANARITGDYAGARKSLERVRMTPGLESIAECWSVVLAALGADFDQATVESDRDDPIDAQPLWDFARECGRDPRLDRIALSSFALWAVGRDARAVAQAERAVAWAERCGDGRGRIWALAILGWLHDMREDWEALAKIAPEIDRASRATGITSWLGLGIGLGVWASAQASGDPAVSVAAFASILVERAESSGTSLPGLLFLLAARIFAWSGDVGRAEAVALRGITLCERTGEHFPLAELCRQVALASYRRNDLDGANRYFERALETARRQGHLVSEIRCLVDREARGLESPDDLGRLALLAAERRDTLGPNELRLLEPFGSA